MVVSKLEIKGNTEAQITDTSLKPNDEKMKNPDPNMQGGNQSILLPTQRNSYSSTPTNHSQKWNSHLKIATLSEKLENKMQKIFLRPLPYSKDRNNTYPLPKISFFFKHHGQTHFFFMKLRGKSRKKCIESKEMHRKQRVKEYLVEEIDILRHCYLQELSRNPVEKKT